MGDSRQVNLVSLTFTNGVNANGVGFITVSAHGADGTDLVAQMSPDECRDQALILLGVAEAAEQDAATLRVLRDLFPEDGQDREMARGLAGLIITKLRAMRPASAKKW